MVQAVQVIKQIGTCKYVILIKRKTGTHIVGDFFNNTVNRVSNVLSWCHQKGGYDQNDEGAFLMKPKDIVVWKKR